MNTNELMEDLARGLEPVRPLGRPGARALAWLVGAALYVGLLAVGMTLLRGPVAGAGWSLWIPQLAALATGALASAAALAAVVPGLASRAPIWAAAAAASWLVTLIAFSPASLDWSAVPGASHEWVCVAFIVIGGAPPMAALLFMLRRGAPLRPVTTAACAALAAASLTNAGACLSLPHDNGAVTFAWHGGIVAVAVVLAAAGARFLFKWPTAPGGARDPVAVVKE